MGRAWCGVGLVWVGLAAAGTAHAQDAGDVLQVTAAADPSTAVVLVRQGSSTCAGAFVGADGRIVTAYHCISDGARARVQTRDGRTAVARVQTRLPRYDLAVLEAPELAGEPWLSVREEPVVSGMVVRAWGHPLGSLAPEGYLAGTLRWSVSEGIIAAVGPRTVQTTAPVNPGNSGGPLVDEQGRLVGVVSRRLRGDGLGFASRVEPLVASLENPDRGSVIGGSFRAALAGSLFGAEDGTASGGVVVEAAIRDRVVLGGSVSLAGRPNFDALRYGSVSWSVAEAWGGLRVRAGQGYWTLRTDVYGGVSVVQTVSRAADAPSLRTGIAQQVRPLVGGRVALATVAIDVGLVPITDREGEPALATRTSLLFLWPGRIGVF